MSAVLVFMLILLEDVLKFQTIVIESTSMVFALNAPKDLFHQTVCVSGKSPTVLPTIHQQIFVDSAFLGLVSLMENATDYQKTVFS